MVRNTRRPYEIRILSGVHEPIAEVMVFFHGGVSASVEKYVKNSWFGSEIRASSNYGCASPCQSGWKRGGKDTIARGTINFATIILFSKAE